MATFRKTVEPDGAITYCRVPTVDATGRPVGLTDEEFAALVAVGTDPSGETNCTSTSRRTTPW